MCALCLYLKPFAGSSYLQQDWYKFWRVILDVDFNEN